MIDVRNQLDRYAAPDTVDWHFSNINNRWTKRALAAAGFGYYTPEPEDSGVQRWKPIFSVAELGGSQSAAAAAEAKARRKSQRVAAAKAGDQAGANDDIEEHRSSSDLDSLDKRLTSSQAYGTLDQQGGSNAVVQGLNRPLFHLDVTAALQSALANAQRKSH